MLSKNTDIWKEEEEKKSSPNKSYFSDVFDNIGFWKDATKANTKETGLTLDIRELYKKIENGEYSSKEEYDRLANQLMSLYRQRGEERDIFQENRQKLHDNESWLEDHAELGGTLQSWATQAKDTAIGAAAGGVIGGLTGGPAGVIPGAKIGATWGNRLGSFDSAQQDVALNAEEARERVLQEGGTEEQAKQAEHDAYWSNVPTEIPEVASNMYWGGKLLKGGVNLAGKAIPSSISKKFAQSGVGKVATNIGKNISSGVSKFQKFDLPQKVGTYVASKTNPFLGSIAEKGTASVIEGLQEWQQEPWQDYATERAVDKQRKIYDPTHEGIRDFSIFGDGGLLDYYTTPEGLETGWKAFKQGAILSGMGGLVTKRNLAKGYNDERATISVDSAVKNFENIKDDIKDDKLVQAKKNFKELSGIDVSKDNVLDFARQYVEFFNNLENDHSQKHSDMVLNELANELTGTGIVERDQMTEKSQKWFEGRNIDGLNKVQPFNEQTTTETTENNANGEIDNVDTVEQTATGQQNGSNNTNQGQGATITASRETVESLKNDDNTPFIDKVHQQGTTEPTVDASWQKRFDARFTPKNEETAGVENKLWEVNGRNIRVTRDNNSVFYVRDADIQNSPAKVFDGENAEDKAYEFLEKIEKGTATIGGQRFKAADNITSETDGAIADKDKPEKSGETKDANRGTFVDTINDWWNYYNNYIRGNAELEKEIGGAYGAFQLARALNVKGFDNSNVSFIFNLANQGSDGNGGRVFGGATFLTKDGRVLTNTGSIAEEAQILRQQGVQRAIIKLYSGADVVTAMHELFHVGFWNMSEQQRRYFYVWAAATQNTFAQRILKYKVMNEVVRRKAENESPVPQDILNTITEKGNEIDVLNYLETVVKAQDEDLYNLVMGDASFNQTFELLKYQNQNVLQLLDEKGQFPEELQRAMEERYAWEGSLWYAEGYVRGIEPINIIQRILNSVCHSLQSALNLVWKCSERLNEKRQIEVDGKTVNYSPISSFSGMSLTPTQQYEQNENIEQQPQVEGQPMYAQEGTSISPTDITQQGEQFNPQRKNGIQNPAMGTLVGEPYSTEGVLQESDFGLGNRKLKTLTNAELIRIAQRVFSEASPNSSIFQEILQELERRGITDFNQKEVGQYTGGENQGQYKENRTPDILFDFNSDQNAQAMAERLVDQFNGNENDIKEALKQGYNTAQTQEQRNFVTNVARRVIAYLGAKRGGTVRTENGFVSGTKAQQTQQLPQQSGLTTEERERITVPWDKSGYGEPRGVKRVSDKLAREIYDRASNGDDNAQRIFSTKIPVEQQREIINEYENKRKEQEEQKRKEELKKQEEERKRKEEEQRKQEELRKQEEERKRQEEERKQREEEEKKRKEAEKKKQEEEKRKQQEEEQKKKEKKENKSIRDLTLEKYGKEKYNSLSDFDKEEVDTDIDAGITSVEDIYNRMDAKDATNEEKQLKVIVSKKERQYLTQFIKKIRKVRSNLDNIHDISMMYELEKRLTELNKNGVVISKKTEEQIKNTVNNIWEEVVKPRLEGKEESYIKKDEKKRRGKEEKRKQEEERKKQEEQKRQEELRRKEEEQKKKEEEEKRRQEEEQKKKEEEERKKKQGNLTDEEYKEYEELSKKKIELKEGEFTNEDLIRWSELDEIKEGKTLNKEGQVVSTSRYMKSTVNNVKTREYMEKLYKDKFYAIGRKMGYDTDRIKKAFNVVKFLEDSITTPYEDKDNLLYLNPKDETMLAQRVKDFAKLNHLANRQLWEMNLRDKNNKTLYGKGMYRSPDGKWMQELSDNNAKFDTNKLSDEMLNTGSLAGYNCVLGDILKHKDLYERHPELKNIPVHFIDRNMVENGEIEGVTVDDLTFAAAYDHKNKQMFVDVDEFLGDKNPFFDSYDIFEKLESGEKEQIQEAINEINEAIDEMMPFILHETQHAVQHAEGRLHSVKGNKIISLILHNDLKKVWKYIKNNGDAKTISLAQKELKNPLSIRQFLDRQNKTEVEQKLGNILDNYMDNDDFYYTDLNEMEAYDTQHRYGTDGKAMPLTLAERDAYQNFEEGKGMVTRHMKCSVNGKNFPFKNQASLAVIEAKYKKDFYFIGEKRGLTKEEIDRAFKKRDELADKTKFLIRLNLKTDKDLKNFVDINDSIRATWWVRGLNNPDSIYSRGVYVDLYGKWCYTIDHSNATVIKEELTNINPHKNYKLGDILNFPELFNEYPELKNMTVKFIKIKENTLGAYSRQTKRININTNKIKDLDTPANIGTLLHEIQHAIQEIEGEFLPFDGVFPYYRQAYIANRKNLINNLDSLVKANSMSEESKDKILKTFDDIVNNPQKFDTMFIPIRNRAGRKTGNYRINATQTLTPYGLSEAETRTLQSFINHDVLNSDEVKQIQERRSKYDQQYVEMMASDVNLSTRPDRQAKGYNPKTTQPLFGRTSYLDFKVGKESLYRFQKGEKLTTQERVQVSNQILNQAFPNVRFQYAWHSSPHDFIAFTLDHLLKGEGSMAHGWGLYFAKNLPKNYANYFREFNGMYADPTIKGVYVSDVLDTIYGDQGEVGAKIFDNLYDESGYVTEKGLVRALQKEISSLKQSLTKDNKQSDKIKQQIKDLNELISEINKYGFDKDYGNKKGRLYLVDIPDNDVLIRKGVSFKDQPPKVQQAITKYIKQLKSVRGLTQQQENEILNSKNIYNTLCKVYMESGNLTYDPHDTITQMRVSKGLNTCGCKGISYNGRLDGECVVVFNNKSIDILSKFKKEEGKWLQEKPEIKREFTKEQQNRVNRRLQENKQQSTTPQNNTRYMASSNNKNITDDQIAREHSNTRSVSFTASAQKNPTNKKIMQYFDSRKKDFERTIDPNTKKVTYTRRRPEAHHTSNITYNDVNDKVVTKTEKYGTKFKIKEELFNDKEAIKKLASDLGVPEAYQKMMVYSLQGQKANVALTEGIEYNGKTVKGLYKIMGMIPEELQPKFTKYAIAFRIIDLEKNRPDIVQKMTADEAREYIKEIQNNKELADLFEKTRKDFVEYNIAMLYDSLVTNGVLSKEKFNELVAKDPNFVPLSKIMDEDVDFGYQSVRGARSLIDIKSPIKSINSSVREIKNPFAEMEKRTYEYYNTGAKNKAALTLINDVVNKIDVLVDGDKIARGQGILRKVQVQEKDGKIITKPDPKNRIFYVCNNGVHEFYQAADPVVYAAMKNFTEQQAQEMSKVLDIMNKISKGMATVVRESATITYDFGGNNGIRDTLGAFVSSEHGFIPIYDTIWGIMQVRKGNKSHYYKEYSGQVGQYAKSTRGELLANNTFKVPSRQLYEGYIKEVKKNYAIATNQKYTTTQRAKAFLKMIFGAPFMALYTNAQNFNEMIEQGTRVAEYKNARQGYNGIWDRIQKGGLAWNVDVSKDVVDKAIAAYKALDVTLFFQQHGNLGKRLNQYTPFFNAYLLGLEKTLNSLDLLFSGKDAMNQTNKTLQKEMLFKVVFFTLMGVAASAAGAGDDDYEEAPDWEKNTFWILPMGVRFGRDEIFGRTIGRIAEEAYTQARHKKFDVKKFSGIAIDAFAPNNIMPTILDIYGGLYMNRDSFTKRDIVPERMKALPGPKQIDMYTSNMAKDFSSVMYALGINVSAKQVNYLLQKHFTNSFKYAEDMYSLITGKESNAMARGYDKNDATGEIVGFLKDEVPRPLNRITGKFITNRTQYQSINEFEDEYKEIKGKEKAKDLNPLTKEEQIKWKKFEKAEKDMNKIRKKLKEIRENNNLKPYQKEAKARPLFKLQVEIAKKALGKE